MPVVLDHNPGASTLPIRDRVRRGQFEHFLVVVPTRRRLRYLTREIIRLVPGTSVPELPLHTLESLGRLLVGEIFGPRQHADGAIQMLLYDSAIKTSTLNYFSLHGRADRLSRGTFEKIVDVVNTLKESGIYPDTLEEEVALAELDEKAKLHDITIIYKGYEEKLAEMGALDTADLFKMLRLRCSQPQFEKAFRTLFPNVDTVSLAGFDEFTEPELDFIRKLCAVKGLSVSLIFDFLPGNTELFGHLEDNYRYFRELGFVDARSRSTAAASMPMLTDQLRMPEIQDGVSRLARVLFNRKVSEPKVDLSQYVVVSQVRNRTQEVELICKIIKQLVHERPDRNLSRLCVAMFQPQLYTDVMRVVFPKYGIPVNITDRFALSRSPLVVAILALLQIPIRGFQRDDVLRALRTPYFVLGSGKSAIDYSNLVAVSSELKITSGYNAWLKRIDNQIMHRSKEIDESSDEKEKASLTRNRSCLEKNRADIELLGNLLAQLSDQVTPREFQRRLVELFDVLQIRLRLVSVRSDVAPAEKDTRAYAAFLDVVEQTVGLLELQGEAENGHSLKYYLDHLHVAILKQRYNVREQFGSGVLVTAIEETRGLPLDVMILAGLVDGEFPSVYQPEVFFSMQRQAEREQKHLWQNRYLFYQAVTNWSEKLYLVYPEKDGDLELVRSTFVDAFQSVADVTEWKDPASTPFGQDLFSEEEALRYAGAHGVDAEFVASLPEHLHSKLESVRKAINVDRSRTETHDLPHFEGIIGDHVPPEVLQSLTRLKERTYSASQLESYGKCPYQFFAQRLLQLKVVEELEEELTPREKGSVLHEALFEFYTARRDRNLPSLTQCSDKEFEEAIAELKRIAEQKLEQTEIPDAFWDLEKETILGQPGMRKGLLREFLEVERQRTTTLEPRYFEVAFGPNVGARRGKDSLLSTEETIAVGNVNLRGKVDRVEIGEGAFAIVDYKTGKDVARIEDIRQGISLQLPLYLYAMEQLLKAKSHLPAAGLYYLLREPVKIQVGIASAEYKGVAVEPSVKPKQLLETNEALRELINEAVTMVNGYVGSMAQGKFPLTTPDKVQKVCTYCEYKTICRIQTVRRVPIGQAEDV